MIKNLKETCEELATAWGKAGGYDTYNSILELLDEELTREDYLSIDPNALIHERVRCELSPKPISDDYHLVISGIMECYDFCKSTENMTPEEIDKFDYECY